MDFMMVICQGQLLLLFILSVNGCEGSYVIQLSLKQLVVHCF